MTVYSPSANTINFHLDTVSTHANTDAAVYTQQQKTHSTLSALTLSFPFLLWEQRINRKRQFIILANLTLLTATHRKMHTFEHGFLCEMKPNRANAVRHKHTHTHIISIIFLHPELSWRIVVRWNKDIPNSFCIFNFPSNFALILRSFDLFDYFFVFEFRRSHPFSLSFMSLLLFFIVCISFECTHAFRATNFS